MTEGYLTVPVCLEMGIPEHAEPSIYYLRVRYEYTQIMNQHDLKVKAVHGCADDGKRNWKDITSFLSVQDRGALAHHIVAAIVDRQQEAVEHDEETGEVEARAPNYDS